jgi:glucose/mannose-6-phosphate isomerase
MVNLDDLRIMKRYDPDGMLTHLHEMPELCERAWRLALDFSLPPDYSKVNKVVVTGMGGSAIGGDLVSGLVASESQLSVFICRDYSLPAFVDAHTLVIVSSYSGMTEETLSAFEQAMRLEAKKLVITTGGMLKRAAEENGIPIFSFDYRAQPRAALPFSLLSILCFLQKLGFIKDKSADVAEAVLVLQQLSTVIDESVVLADNLAKQLAARLYGRLSVIYGAGIFSEVAHRWKTQINENSKAWAFYENFPELNHNAVVGYQFPPELADRIEVVLLRSALLPERIRLRYQITCNLLEQAGIGYFTVDAQGASPLSQLMSLILFGDYVSYYLAILYAIDPAPVKVIDYLKEQLARGK